MKTERIHFNIKYRADIEAGRYRVSTRNGKPARIVCWDMNYTILPYSTKKPLLVIATDEDGNEYDYHCFITGKRWLGEKSDYDLFLVPVEQDRPMTELEYLLAHWLLHDTDGEVTEYKLRTQAMSRAREVLDTIQRDMANESQKEQNICTITGWVARDKDGELRIYDCLPQRKIISDVGVWITKGRKSYTLKSNAVPTLTWEDEPIEVELTIKRKEDE